MMDCVTTCMIERAASGLSHRPGSIPNVTEICLARLMWESRVFYLVYKIKYFVCVFEHHAMKTYGGVQV
jgi:hypothetical protein